jgi:ubiquinone/menaquinone biosynthesis C-methylase UbiE
MISEVYRVLKPNGKYVVVSYGTPENREIYLKKVSTIFLMLIFLGRI